ncbi:helix-turn-helix domain-containing protein, partial [Acidisoma silvae]
MSDVVAKWGKAVAERGFAQIPTYLLNLNRFLDKENRLSPTELLVVFQLVGSWWKTDEKPFPAMTTLANRCGVSSRQVQRAINHLVEMKLIERIT